MMKQMVQNLRSGAVEMREVPLPQVGKGEILVETRASLISAGTERMMMEFAGKSLLGKARERPDLVKKVRDKMQRDGAVDTLRGVFGRLDEPLPLGYAAAGVVMKVGAGAAFAVGDRVAVAGAGLANHAEVNVVPVNLAVRLPEEVPFEDGCYATLAAIAMHGLRNAQVQLGDRVLVVGLGLVGQLMVQLCAAAGAQVAALDPASARRDVARAGGALLVADGQGAEAALREFTRGRGFDAVLICAASDDDTVITQVADWARDRAKVVLVGKVGTRFPYAAYMKKELDVKVSRSYGPGRYDPAFEQQGLTYPAGFVPWTERDNLAEAVRLMASGSLRPSLLTTHRFTFEKALQAYDLIKAGHKSLGVVLAYAEHMAEAGAAPGKKVSPSAVAGPQPLAAGQVLGVGVIGTGGYARNLLLPLLGKELAAAGARLSKVTSRSGLSAAQVARVHGGEAVSGMEAVLADPHTQAVMIVTRHNLHAAQVQAALAAGKQVWVEKPLALTPQELDAVEKSLAHRPEAMLMVGYNRRFSPHVQALQSKLATVNGPRQVLIRVNAGRLPDDPGASWQQGAEGGGRLLGEVCHFTDLALALAGSPVNKVQAVRGSGQDVYSVQLTHADGSQSTIVYTSEGQALRGKEWLEVHAGGCSGVIDNFRQSSWYNGAGHKILVKTPFWRGADKGQRTALRLWLQQCRENLQLSDGQSMAVEADSGKIRPSFPHLSPTPKELVHSTRIIHAASASIDAGTAVFLG